jgi:AcrR family transcriptional regulator
MTPSSAARSRPVRPGPRRRAGEPDSTRQALFEAAAREFALHGFAGASVDRIAAAARLNKAMIYYHFGSKARLYAEILHDMFSAVAARVRAVAASNAAPEAKIRQFVAAIATEAEARPHFPPIWFREIADEGRHFGDDTAREVASIVGTLAGMIEEGVRAGVFVPAPHMLVHTGVIGPLLLFFASTRLRARLSRARVPGAAELNRDQVIAHIQNVTLGVLRGMTAGPGRKAKSRSA